MAHTDSESKVVFQAGWLELMPRFFAGFVVTAGAGVMVFGCVMGLIKDGIEWGLGFSIPAAFMVFLALFVLRASRAAEAIAGFSGLPLTDLGMVKRRAFTFRKSIMPDWDTPPLSAVEQGRLWRAARNTRNISNSMAAGSAAIDS